MEKREFIKRSVLGVGGLLLSDKIFAANNHSEEFSELAKHKIGKTELVTLDYQWPRFVGKNGARDVHGQYNKASILKIHTDQGAMGWGISHPGAAKELSVLEGRSVAELVTPDKGLANGLNPFYFDLPLFDLLGVIMNKPVYEILGAKGKKQNPVYSGMIYLDEIPYKEFKGGLDTIMDNCAWDYNYGYRQFKIKIGRGKNWYPAKEGMKMDVKVVKMIYEEYKDKGVDILVDANNSYSLDDTITFLKGVQDIPIYWVEEPFPEAMETGKKLRTWMDGNGFAHTRYADGEWIGPDDPNDIALKMARTGILNTYLNDIHAIGITNWKKIMPKLKKAGATASPHTWGDRLKTHYATHLAAGCGNIPTIEGVTCLSDDIDYGDYPIRNGKIEVSDKPGFGMKLLK
ncbi:enolase C-terminal domain-like protein [Maribacter sp. 2304DJ31-5]|uniref:enolase C-terminal domain-like protein n=1 Tax=Maribacter sp. 2304DJ31-5 TaxID=3386273 RepID=UPI0039BD9238